MIKNAIIGALIISNLYLLKIAHDENVHFIMTMSTEYKGQIDVSTVCDDHISDIIRKHREYSKKPNLQICQATYEDDHRDVILRLFNDGKEKS
jgi:hypothetical protein